MTQIILADNFQDLRRAEAIVLILTNALPQSTTVTRMHNARTAMAAFLAPVTMASLEMVCSARVVIITSGSNNVYFLHL